MATTPASTPTVEGRWTVYVCTACGECTGRHNDCDAKRVQTPVVPVDIEAQAAAVLALQQLLETEGDKATLNDIVNTVLKGAATA